jgi:hypothetical protein
MSREEMIRLEKERRNKGRKSRSRSKERRGGYRDLPKIPYRPAKRDRSSSGSKTPERDTRRRDDRDNRVKYEERGYDKKDDKPKSVPSQVD